MSQLVADALPVQLAVLEDVFAGGAEAQMQGQQAGLLPCHLQQLSPELAAEFRAAARASAGSSGDWG
jgi:hypothetical protein